MQDDITRQSVLFPDLFGKPVQVAFDLVNGSSDGGALLLKAADERLGLTARLAACVRDTRQPGKVDHLLEELLRQRTFAITCGYPDGNDAARLADDPVHKMLAGRDPVSGEALASQPTLSRFENAIDRKTLFRMGSQLADVVVERHRRRLGRKAKLITIDLDPTDDPTHGGQQLSFFNGHYDSWCYLPVAAFLKFNDEPEHYLYACILRPGNAPARLGAIGLLRRTIERLTVTFPKARILVRLDGGFAGPEMFDFLDETGVGYVVAMAGNTVLSARAEKMMKKSRRKSEASGCTEHLYGQTLYGAKSWGKKRRVVIKAEVVRLEDRSARDNARFVVTNLTQGPKWVYERVYCQRGDVENRIKELHHGVEIDRTSCTRFWANQVRVMLTAAAYVLMQELRLACARTDSARAQAGTLRERLIKIGARVDESVRRIVLHLPETFPFAADWRRAARALGATT